MFKLSRSLIACSETDFCCLGHQRLVNLDGDVDRIRLIRKEWADGDSYWGTVANCVEPLSASFVFLHSMPQKTWNTRKCHEEYCPLNFVDCRCLDDGCHIYRMHRWQQWYCVVTCLPTIDPGLFVAAGPIAGSSGRFAVRSAGRLR